MAPVSEESSLGKLPAEGLAVSSKFVLGKGKTTTFLSKKVAHVPETETKSAPEGVQAKETPPGPVCGNPACGAYGHTIAVCPVPTSISKEGTLMSGCFFCNTAEHDADDCAMMEWATPATLVHYLITNRAGLPPWDTRIDWVRLALDQWDLVSLTALPLTREFAEDQYIPLSLWQDIKGLSHITDPFFANITHERLKELASPGMYPAFTQEYPGLCSDTANCPHQFGHAIFKNEYAKALIPKRVATAVGTIAAEGIAAAAKESPNQQPKEATRQLKGRRDMKKEREALITAAVTAVAEGAGTLLTPTTVADTSASASSSAAVTTIHNNTTSDNLATAGSSRNITHGQAEDRASTFETDSPETSISDRLKEFSDAMEDMIKWVQNMQRS